MRIRELKIQDFVKYEDMIFNLLLDTYMINFQMSQDECIEICKEKMKLLVGYLENGTVILFGAFEEVVEGKHENRMDGFLWLYKHDYFGEQRLHINQIAVSQQFRGKGIGKRLMNEAENQAKENGIDVIDLFVSEGNIGATKMYDSFGFKTERRYLSKKLVK